MMEEKINNVQSRIRRNRQDKTILLWWHLKLIRVQVPIRDSNEWDDDEKALKDVTVDILETMPASPRNNYNDLMVVL